MFLKKMKVKNNPNKQIIVYNGLIAQKKPNITEITDTENHFFFIRKLLMSFLIKKFGF